MRSVRAWTRRLLGVLSTSRATRELQAELDSHLEMHIDDNVRAGMAPDEARRAALVALGGVVQTTEAYRERRGLPFLTSLAQDARYGIRALLHRPAFAVAAVVILALGIGANTAIFTVVNAVVLKPLPFDDADRIVRLWQTPPPASFPGVTTFTFSPANFIDWEQQAQSFERMAIYRSGRQTLTGHGDPDAVIVVRTSASFLPILGLSPSSGRGFTAEDDAAGGPRTALLSEAFVQSKFGGNPDIIGQTVDLNRIPHEVIGIVPNARAFVTRAQVWVPLAWTPEDRAVRNNHNYLAIARLEPGVSIEQAHAEVTAISDRLAAAYPEDNKDWGGLVRLLQHDLVGEARQSLLLLLGAVGLVLLIACANLANLMLVHTHGRSKEIAVRGALGASRARLVKQLLTEGAALGVVGGLLGLLVAFYGVRLLATAMGTALPRAAEVQVDGRVLLFTAIVAVLTGLLAAVIPAVKLTGRRAGHALAAGPSRGNSGADGRIRNLFVVSEVALAFMLLTGAGLLVRSLDSLRAVDPGFDPTNTLTATIQIPTAKYSDEARRNKFFADVLQNVRSIPGVEAAAWIDNVPFDTGGSIQYVHPEGMPPRRESELPVVALRMPSPGYFDVSRIGLLAGRDFNESDRFGRPRVVIVSDRTARRFWPDQNPIGKQLTLTMLTKEPAEVIGVVRDVKLEALHATDADSDMTVYAPAAQFAYNGSNIVVRTAGDPLSLERSIVGAVHAVDPEQPVLNITTLERLVEASLGQRPFAMQLLGVFALLAVVLASVGIYSVLAYTVRQRTREIGIRMALGASGDRVLRQTMLEGLKPTAIGIGLGSVLAVLLADLMRSQVFGVSERDPVTFGLVAVLMIVVGLAATVIPAFRATRVDPIATLRAE